MSYFWIGKKWNFKLEASKSFQRCPMLDNTPLMNPSYVHFASKSLISIITVLKYVNPRGAEHKNAFFSQHFPHVWRICGVLGDILKLVAVAQAPPVENERNPTLPLDGAREKDQMSATALCNSFNLGSENIEKGDHYSPTDLNHPHQCINTVFM